MTVASGIAAAQPRNRVQERERQLLIFAFSWGTAASNTSQWQLRAQRVSSENQKAAAQIRQTSVFPPNVLDRRQTNVEQSLNRLTPNDR